jgi:hypothetical protein
VGFRDAFVEEICEVILFRLPRYPLGKSCFADLA